MNSEGLVIVVVYVMRNVWWSVKGLCINGVNINRIVWVGLGYLIYL